MYSFVSDLLGFILVYHGARGRYHYFECQQIILRKQVAALLELWELPKEFEVSGAFLLPFR